MREVTGITERKMSLIEGHFDELLAALDARLASLRHTFLTRATASLIKHLEDHGETEVWSYDPTGLRVLLRSGYGVFTSKAARICDEIFAKTRASFEESMAASSSWIDKSDGFYVQQRNRVLGI